MMFKLYRSIVEFNPTSLSVVPGPMLSSNRHVILQCFMLVFLNYCHLMDAFELGKLQLLRKINLNQTVGTRDKI
jgi:nitrate reductase gamma subunit